MDISFIHSFHLNFATFELLPKNWTEKRKKIIAKSGYLCTNCHKNE
jgi:hypothetical protein